MTEAGDLTRIRPTYRDYIQYPVHGACTIRASNLHFFDRIVEVKRVDKLTIIFNGSEIDIESAFQKLNNLGVWKSLKSLELVCPSEYLSTVSRRVAFVDKSLFNTSLHTIKMQGFKGETIEHASKFVPNVSRVELRDGDFDYKQVMALFSNANTFAIDGRTMSREDIVSTLNEEVSYSVYDNNVVSNNSDLTLPFSYPEAICITIVIIAIYFL